MHLPQTNTTDGVAETSQPWQPKPARHDFFTQPTQVSPERPRPKSDCPDRRQPARDNLAYPSHGIAKTSRAIRPARSTAYQPHDTVSRMVSQKRPKGLANSRTYDVSPTRRPRCHRSVPRSTEAASVPSGVCGAQPLLAVWDPQ